MTRTVLPTTFGCLMNKLKSLKLTNGKELNEKLSKFKYGRIDKKIKYLQTFLKIITQKNLINLSFLLQIAGPWLEFSLLFFEKNLKVINITRI